MLLSSIDILLERQSVVIQAQPHPTDHASLLFVDIQSEYMLDVAPSYCPMDKFVNNGIL